MVESIYKSDTEKKLLELFEVALQEGPFRIVDLDCRVAGKSLLRLFIERTTTGTVTIGDCALVSRQLDPVIETSEIFSGPYELEVSSPGLDRRLRLQSDFEKAVGKELKLELTEKLENVGGSLRGTLEKTEPQGLVLSFQGKEILINLNKVKRAQTVFLDTDVNVRV